MSPPTRRHRTRSRARHSSPISFKIPASIYRRPIPKLLLALVFAWVGWQIVANTAADTLADSDPAAALAWSSHHAAALTILANDTFSGKVATSASGNEPVRVESEPPVENSGDNRVERVATLAGRALRNDPLNEQSLRILALTAEAKGDSSRAKSLMILAAQRSKRDLAVQSWLLNRSLEDKDFTGAVERADAMLRVRPELGEFVLPIFVALVTDAEGAKVLIDRLATDPPWRKWFLTALPGQVSAPALLEALFADLRKGPSPPTIDEYRPFLYRLIELGDIENAYAIRVDVSSEEWMGGVGNVNNGAFEYPLIGLPFGWVIAPILGADAEVVNETTANKALRVQFHNTRVPYRNVSQLLLLRPGAYELSGRVKAALTNDRGLQWTIFCYAGKKEVLGESERISGTLAWRNFVASFAVPVEKDCQAQVLQLVLPARVPAEQKISGEIWYDDIAIARSDTALAN